MAPWCLKTCSEKRGLLFRQLGSVLGHEFILLIPIDLLVRLILHGKLAFALRR